MADGSACEDSPCVDEFLTRAKEKPDEIKDPSAYRQK